MFCTSCGNQLADDAKFCKYCGSPILEEEDLEEVNSEYEDAEYEEVEETDSDQADNNKGKADSSMSREEKIENYLSNVKRKQEKAEDEERARILKKVGLTDRKYGGTRYTDQYPKYDGDKDRYYRAEPMEVSDEEWEKIKNAYQVEKSLDPKDETPVITGESGNSIAGALKAIGVITYIAGFILGIVMGMGGGALKSMAYYGVGYGGGNKFSFALALVFWVAGFVMGTMMLGFGEIVRLLHSIDQKTK